MLRLLDAAQRLVTATAALPWELAGPARFNGPAVGGSGAVWWHNSAAAARCMLLMYLKAMKYMIIIKNESCTKRL